MAYKIMFQGMQLLTNIFKTKQYGLPFWDNHFKLIAFNENRHILMLVSLNFICKSPVANNPINGHSPSSPPSITWANDELVHRHLGLWFVRGRRPGKHSTLCLDTNRQLSPHQICASCLSKDIAGSANLLQSCQNTNHICQNCMKYFISSHAFINHIVLDNKTQRSR